MKKISSRKGKSWEKQTVDSDDDFMLSKRQTRKTMTRLNFGEHDCSGENDVKTTREMDGSYFVTDLGKV